MLGSAPLRAALGIAYPITWQAIDANGEPADPGTVTVTYARADGTSLGSLSVSGTGTAARTATVPAVSLDRLDQILISWTVGSTVVRADTLDVVSAPYYSNAEVRASEPALADSAKYPAAKLAESRRRVEALIEDVTNTAWVPRYTYTVLPAADSAVLVLQNPYLRRVRSVDFVGDDGVVSSSLTTTQCAAIQASAAGLAYRDSGWSSDVWVRIGYEHGAPYLDPEIKWAAMRLSREHLARAVSGIPEGATNYTSSELGWSAVLITPGVRGAHTHVADVNDALDRHTFVTIGIG